MTCGLIDQWIIIGRSKTAQFDEWRAGRIKATELSSRAHQFDKGPAHKTYSLCNLMDQELVLARAVVEGFLTKAEMPEEVCPFATHFELCPPFLGNISPHFTAFVSHKL